jgi:AraC-like DNA-binding protein
LNSFNFSNYFSFNIFKFERFHLTDNSKIPTARHYFGCITKGSAEIESKHKKITIKPNEIFYIPKGLKYQSRWFAGADGQIEFYSFGFELSPINKSFVLQKVNCSKKAKKVFDELCREIPITGKGIGRLYYFFGEIADDMQQASNTYTNTVIENAMEYMDRHPDLKIADVAKHCNISESGIYALFKRNLNQTPNEVRLKILCEKAVLLLTTTDRSIQDISDTLGFSSTSYFRKTLKQHTGKTPSSVRKEATF